MHAPDRGDRIALPHCSRTSLVAHLSRAGIDAALLDWTPDQRRSWTPRLI